MFYEEELEINGDKFIRADKAVEHVKKMEKESGEKILNNIIDDNYKMTEEEYYSVSDLFDYDIGDRKFIEIENATVHVLNKEQFRKINKILNCYYDLAFTRLYKDSDPENNGDKGES
jgi:hypothetical protein